MPLHSSNHLSSARNEIVDESLGAWGDQHLRHLPHSPHMLDALYLYLYLVGEAAVGGWGMSKATACDN